MSGIFFKTTIAVYSNYTPVISDLAGILVGETEDGKKAVFGGNFSTEVSFKEIPKECQEIFNLGVQLRLPLEETCV